MDALWSYLGASQHPRAERDRYGFLSWLNHYLVGDIKQMMNDFNSIALKDKVGYY